MEVEAIFLTKKWFYSKDFHIFNIDNSTLRLVQYESLQYKKGNSLFADEYISEEVALQIVVNQKPITVTMCSPSNLKDLTLGLLYSENICKSAQHGTIEINSSKFPLVANVKIADKFIQDGYLNNRNFLSVASCGICGKTNLDVECGVLEKDVTLSFNEIESYFKQMNANQLEFAKSGGVHAAAIFDKEGKLLVVREDIGRHNAMDKAIGNLLSKAKLKKATTLIVSGRVSYEIVLKTFRAKIPILAAVSAPSSLAIDFAKEFNISLLGFCRKGRGTCYSATHRIKNEVHE